MPSNGKQKIELAYITPTFCTQISARWEKFKSGDLICSHLASHLVNKVGQEVIVRLILVPPYGLKLLRGMNLERLHLFNLEGYLGGAEGVGGDAEGDGAGGVAGEEDGGGVTFIGHGALVGVELLGHGVAGAEAC